jgi:hypothetical protein
VAKIVAKDVPMYHTTVTYDSEIHGFAMHLDGELIGFARTVQEAEATLEQILLELSSKQYHQAHHDHQFQESVAMARESELV